MCRIARWRMFAIVIGLLVASPGAAKETVIDLGGLRRVSVRVDLVDEKYVLTARMLPVATFDAATNARLSRERGIQYALTALGRHLSKSNKARFEMSGATVVRSGQEGKFYSLTLSIPRNGVKLLPADTKVPLVAAPGKPIRVDPFAGSFFTRKSDYLLTLEQVATGLHTDLKAAEGKVGKDPRTVQAFLIAAAELEDRGSDCFKKLLAEVKRDDLLLALEKDEILTALKSRQKKWLDGLMAAVKRHENSAEDKAT